MPLIRSAMLLLFVLAAPALAAPQYAGGQSEIRSLYADIRRAQAELNRAILQVRREHSESAEYQLALADVMQAAADLRSARSATVSMLVQSPEFATIRIRIEHLSRELESSRRDAGQRARVGELANELLRHRGEVSALEAQALGEDETYQDARFAMIDAVGRVASLRRDLDHAIRTDPLVAAARERLAQARQRLRDHVRR